MLIVARRLGERIKIGEDVTLTVVDIRRGRVRLGFDAPERINIVFQDALTTFLKPGEYERAKRTQAKSQPRSAVHDLTPRDVEEREFDSEQSGCS